MGGGNCRLVNQIEKQEAFRTLIKNDNYLSLIFDVPRINSTRIYKNEYFVNMQYCNGLNIIDFFERRPISEIYSIIDKLFFFIEKNLDSSKLSLVNNSIFLSKVDELLTKIGGLDMENQDFFINLLNEIKQYLFSNEYLELYVGSCHGDLTFSNIIINDKINLIDFLDTYLESPLQDLTKIKQEVDLNWSFMMSNQEKRDNTKIYLGYTYIQKYFNKKIEKLRETYLIKEEVFDIIYQLTLLRILPYSKEKNVQNKIYNILNNMKEKK